MEKEKDLVIEPPWLPPPVLQLDDSRYQGRLSYLCPTLNLSQLCPSFVSKNGPASLVLESVSCGLQPASVSCTESTMVSFPISNPSSVMTALELVPVPALGHTSSCLQVPISCKGSSLVTSAILDPNSLMAVPNLASSPASVDPGFVSCHPELPLSLVPSSPNPSGSDSFPSSSSCASSVLVSDPCHTTVAASLLGCSMWDSACSGTDASAANNSMSSVGIPSAVTAPLSMEGMNVEVLGSEKVSTADHTSAQEEVLVGKPSQVVATADSSQNPPGLMQKTTFVKNAKENDVGLPGPETAHSGAAMASDGWEARESISPENMDAIEVELEEGEISGEWEQDEDSEAAAAATTYENGGVPRNQMQSSTPELLEAIAVAHEKANQALAAALSSNHLGKSHTRNNKRRKGKGAIARQRKKLKLKTSKESDEKRLQDGNSAMSKDGVKPAEESDSKTGEKRKQSGVNKVSLNKEPEHVEVPREENRGLLSSLIEEEVGLWTTDIGDEQITSAQVEIEGDNKKKMRGPITAERKAKKKIAYRIKRARNERKQGIVRNRMLLTSKPTSVPCTFYLKGRCTLGADCTFSHDVVPVTKSEPCKFFMINRCLKGDDCPFSHSLNLFPCKFFHTRGLCLDGDNCPFSHEPLTEEQRKNLQKRLEHDSKEQRTASGAQLVVATSAITSLDTHPDKDSAADYAPTWNTSPAEALGWNVSTAEYMPSSVLSCENTSIQSSMKSSFRAEFPSTPQVESYENTSMQSSMNSFRAEFPSTPQVESYENTSMRSSMNSFRAEFPSTPQEESLLEGSNNFPENHVVSILERGCEGIPSENAVLQAAKRAAAAAAAKAAGTSAADKLTFGRSTRGLWASPGLTHSISAGNMIRLHGRVGDPRAMEPLQPSLESDIGNENLDNGAQAKVGRNVGVGGSSVLSDSSFGVSEVGNQVQEREKEMHRSGGSLDVVSKLPGSSGCKDASSPVTGETPVDQFRTSKAAGEQTKGSPELLESPSTERVTAVYTRRKKVDSLLRQALDL